MQSAPVNLPAAGTWPPPGVQYNSPPATILAQATKLVLDVAQTIPAGHRVTLVAVATTKGGNAAIAARLLEGKQDLAIVSWIGKADWGQPLEAGTGVVWSF